MWNDDKNKNIIFSIFKNSILDFELFVNIFILRIENKR